MSQSSVGLAEWAQGIEDLSSKCEALSSNPSTNPQKKKKKRHFQRTALIIMALELKENNI
jgi:hypothetical protein